MGACSHRIEVLFKSVEIVLARQHVFRNVSQPFGSRPQMHIRMVVKVWWHLYHESICARQARNRVIWERSPFYPAETLELARQHVAGLQEIRQLLDTDSLLIFRPLSNVEEAGLCLLALLTTYYTNPQSETWKQIL